MTLSTFPLQLSEASLYPILDDQAVFVGPSSSAPCSRDERREIGVYLYTQYPELGSAQLASKLVPDELVRWPKVRRRGGDTMSADLRAPHRMDGRNSTFIRVC